MSVIRKLGVIYSPTNTYHYILGYEAPRGSKNRISSIERYETSVNVGYVVYVTDGEEIWEWKRFENRPVEVEYENNPPSWSKT